MPKGLQKSIRIYISKLKKPAPQSQNGRSHRTTSWLLSACKYPKTPSFAADRHRPNAARDGDDDKAATLIDIDRFLFENFKSLYTTGCEDDDAHTKNVINITRNHLHDDADNDDGTDRSTAIYDSSPRFLKTPPNLRPSQRFFVSPCTSNSLAEEAAESSRPSSEDLPGESIAVLTYTRDPYDDFRRSMQEIVEARQVDRREPLDWDFMEDLLFCYLNLNEKKAHKYILGAFVDVMVGFRQQRECSSGKTPARGGGQKAPAGGERRRKLVGRRAGDILRVREGDSDVELEA
ncbi:hypothetical protein ACLOJK_031821 [Asimina triloba]